MQANHHEKRKKKLVEHRFDVSFLLLTYSFLIFFRSLFFFFFFVLFAFDFAIFDINRFCCNLPYDRFLPKRKEKKTNRINNEQFLSKDFNCKLILWIDMHHKSPIRIFASWLHVFHHNAHLKNTTGAKIKTVCLHRSKFLDTLLRFHNNWPRFISWTRKIMIMYDVILNRSFSSLEIYP